MKCGQGVVPNFLGGVLGGDGLGAAGRVGESVSDCLLGKVLVVIGYEQVVGEVGFGVLCPQVVQLLLFGKVLPLLC